MANYTRFTAFGIFDDGRGAATVFIPVEDVPFTVPPAELAVIRH